jgi:hypothetical protein
MLKIESFECELLYRNSSDCKVLRRFIPGGDGAEIWGLGAGGWGAGGWEKAELVIDDR